MEKYTVKQLAELAGISVRALHHYDRIGLLRPDERSESNYRYYGEKELLRLQQILLYRELDIPLAQIAKILDDPGFNVADALLMHKKELQKRKAKMAELIRTIDRTIDHVNKKEKKMDHKEMYKGFTKNQAEAWTKEAEEKWGKKAIADSHKKIMKMNVSEWERLKQWGDDIYTSLVNRMHLSPSDAEIQALIAQHFEMTGHHFDVTIPVYRDLGKMYADDERFTAFYDRYHPQLATFLRDSIFVYCDDHK
ncbi:MAG: MerR family transcriptional regulator [Bacteroidia bacterium]